ncbi:ervatamin-C-like [Triticum dicoccoides]|uniref:ervatamin-C-like n=1 Tax=Triticum dicoccoides TaxID=85692 RepID=UPI00188F6C3B|nr:ervatamin-C-like [Triticum dicoccoides]
MGIGTEEGGSLGECCARPVPNRQGDGGGEEIVGRGAGVGWTKELVWKQFTAIAPTLSKELRFTHPKCYFINTGKLVPLSEQQLVDCDKYDNSCNRGYYHMAFQWIMEDGGLTTAVQYLYKAVRGACTRGKPTITITGHAAVPKNEPALQSAIARQPIGVAIEVPSSMQSCKSGVFSPPCGIQMSHAVVTVSYGTDASSRLKYWLVKNSWGEAGYIRMRRDVGGSGLCSITLDTAYLTM